MPGLENGPDAESGKEDNKNLQYGDQSAAEKRKAAREEFMSGLDPKTNKEAKHIAELHEQGTFEYIKPDGNFGGQNINIEELMAKKRKIDSNTPQVPPADV